MKIYIDNRLFDSDCDRVCLSWRGAFGLEIFIVRFDRYSLVDNPNAWPVLTREEFQAIQPEEGDLLISDQDLDTMGQWALKGGTPVRPHDSRIEQHRSAAAQLRWRFETEIRRRRHGGVKWQ